MKKNKKITITIDGPAASGKSTTARQVAKYLGYVYIDSGAMYRAVTLKALKYNIDVNDSEAIAEIANNLEIEFGKNADKTIIFLDGRDVSEEIRTPQIDQNISPVAANAKVRDILVKKQQRLGKHGGVVMDGRDIGTVVFPFAELKIFMVAGVKERAKRRHKEQALKGIVLELRKIIDDIHYRDQQDRDRDYGPLKKATDAIEIDTTSLSVEEQVEKILTLVKKQIGNGNRN